MVKAPQAPPNSATAKDTPAVRRHSWPAVFATTPVPVSDDGWNTVLSSSGAIT